tara:strand:+ start:90961 stop:91146 length:186 start_codon:yes stop_codon:yes gene_type:complete
MAFYTKILGVCLVSLTFGIAGCDTGGDSGEPAAASQDELSQFLSENPEIANATEEAVDDGE